ncbi:acyl CoA:acetate/3-ketoacid CoA transferase [Sulfitobacter mediterraneus]|uniref:acyl CoA:acetate/3-ketoacid CoA transferase n=1 Tax=Sulfitobacter mediterraneus TaxID=83219 RepID=UPI0021A28A67|nr:CoA-transferase [Sulfitobacter mediterraneus]UWR13381.1 acyl CoA:acetate/3-ketoacid CoA transferase [Sulfitobacter mediterraneus]
MPNKTVSPEAAAALIADGNIVTTSGFVGIGVPETLLKAVSTRFQKIGAPKDLTLFFAAGQGDGKEKGLNHFAHKEMLKRVVGGHWGLIPNVGKMAVDNVIEAYNLPQGVISQMYRDIAAGKPGTLSKVGLETFVDPRKDGGKLNKATQENLVRLMEIDGEEYLFYRAMPIDVALLRGTTADTAGNVTMENEALTIDNLSQAMAAKNSGGVVIVQVEQVVARGSLNPRDVEIPGALVDAVVLAEPGDHMQTFSTLYSPAFTGRYRLPSEDDEAIPLDARKVIARRAAFELPVNGIVNLGIGMPEGVAAVAREERLLDHLTLTAEPGVIGGQPASGLDFGAAVNTDAVIAQNQQFDFYDGGGLDIAVLGMAEVDGQGSVNVSRFGPRLAGAGGFINISQNAHKVVFAGTFTSVALDVAITDGALQIRSEGRVQKFVDAVEHTTFFGPRAGRLHQSVLFVTERCVFRLGPDGLSLVEVAPGIDIERDILTQMAFRPIVEDLSEMDARIFADGPMGLDVDLLALDLDTRIALGSDGKRFFINLEKLRIRDLADVTRIVRRVEEVCSPLDQKVDAIVNYDGTVIYPEAEEAYAKAVQTLEDRYYRTTTRYSASAFMRLKLGKLFASSKRSHIFESEQEAQTLLNRGGSS